MGRRLVYFNLDNVVYDTFGCLSKVFEGYDKSKQIYPTMKRTWGSERGGEYDLCLDNETFLTEVLELSPFGVELIRAEMARGSKVRFVCNSRVELGYLRIQKLAKDLDGILPVYQLAHWDTKIDVCDVEEGVNKVVVYEAIPKNIYRLRRRGFEVIVVDQPFNQQVMGDRVVFR